MKEDMKDVEKDDSSKHREEKSVFTVKKESVSRKEFIKKKSLQKRQF